MQFVAMCVVMLGICVPDDNALLTAIRDAYETNRAGFAYGTLTSEYTIGEGSRSESGIAWTKQSIAAVYYAYDGRRNRFEIMYPEAEQLESRIRTGANSYTSNVPPSVRVLTNSSVTLSDTLQVTDNGAVSHQAVINQGTDAFSKVALAPLFVGIPRPGSYFLTRVIDDVLNGRYGSTLENVCDVEYGGNQITQVTFVSAQTKTRMQWWIDLRRGAIPLQYVGTKDGKEQVRVSHDDIRYVADKGWFPFHQVVVRGPFIKQLVIKEADFQRVPDAGSFRLEFPKPSRVLDTVRGVRYAADQTVFDLDDLPPIRPGAAQRITIIDTPPTNLSLAKERPAGSRWIIPCVIGSILLSISGMLLWRRRHNG